MQQNANAALEKDAQNDFFIPMNSDCSSQDKAFIRAILLPRFLLQYIEMLGRQQNVLLYMVNWTVVAQNTCNKLVLCEIFKLYCSFQRTQASC